MFLTALRIFLITYLLKFSHTIIPPNDIVTRPSDAPFFAALRSGGHFCGGTLILPE